MRRWKLFWSPEGRQISTVQAKTAQAAIRKAPAPYKAFPGEIYAEDDGEVPKQTNPHQGQNMSDATTQLLVEALAKISQDGAWTQGAFARLEPGGRAVTAYNPAATCWCSHGVCRSLNQADDDMASIYHRAAVQAEARLSAWTKANHGLSLETFNDARGRTQAEVVAMFKAAIAAGPLPYQVKQKEIQS